MISDVRDIIICLEKSPSLLNNMLAQIPEIRLKQRRIPGKWSIHEHTCHLADTQPMLVERLKIFKNEKRPAFVPFLPGKDIKDDHLLEMDLNKSLKDFADYRSNMIALVRNVEEYFWQKIADHPEYLAYTPYILLRHVLMHDHLHMYRIEELWLTNNEFLITSG